MKQPAALVPALLLALALTSVAPAPAAGGGALNFSWSPDGNCVHPLVTNRTFACNTNSASFTAVGSVHLLYDAVPQFWGIEATISCQSEGPLPAWWQAYDSGSCRATSAMARTTSVAAGGCKNPWPVTPMGGISAWQTALNPPSGHVLPANRLLIQVVFVMPTTRIDLGANQEFNAFQLVLDANHAVDDPAAGIVACAGCGMGVALTLSWMNLFYGSSSVVAIASPHVDNCITWQSSAAECWNSTPARNTTWGAIKAFYR
jgi:hypothetical protein